MIERLRDVSRPPTDELSMLPEANPNIVLVLRCPGSVEYLNPTGRRWLADRGSDSIDDLFLLLPAHFRDEVCDFCDRVQRRQWSIECEGKVYDVKMTPLADRRRCMLTIDDVTEFRRLRREHEMFYRAFRTARSAILVTDVGGSIEFVNDHFEELYGYRADDVIGRNPRIVNPGREVYRELGFTDGEYDELFRGMWSAIRDPKLGFWEGELPNRAADGRVIWVRLLVQSVRDDEGEVAGYIGFPVDITDTRAREREVRLEIYEAITDLGELRDNETGNHIRRVGLYAQQLALRLKLSRRFQEDILSFAPLHDIGKVGIPDEILLAPRKLSDAEFALMQRHTTMGYRLFRDRPSLEMAADIAHGHHERWDGNGYPQRLAGPDTPLSARIVAVCDVYDALRSLRPYKPVWSHEDTVECIREGRGSQFDPEVVDAFLSCEVCVRGIHDGLPDEGIEP